MSLLLALCSQAYYIPHRNIAPSSHLQEPCRSYSPVLKGKDGGNKMPISPINQVLPRWRVKANMSSHQHEAFNPPLTCRAVGSDHSRISSAWWRCLSPPEERNRRLRTRPTHWWYRQRCSNPRLATSIPTQYILWYRLGGTNHALDIQNPDNLGQQATDNGVVKNLKWSFSDSKTRIFRGGWTRQQTIDDLPSSHDIAAAQQHLKKGAIRELHWHRVVSQTSTNYRELRLRTCRLNGVIYTLEVSLFLQLMNMETLK